MASEIRPFRSLPLWRRIVLGALAPIVFPVALVAMLVIVVPVALVNGSYFVVHWARWKLFGVPIPPKAPPPV